MLSPCANIIGPAKVVANVIAVPEAFSVNAEIVAPFGATITC